MIRKISLYYLFFFSKFSIFFSKFSIFQHFSAFSSIFQLFLFITFYTTNPRLSTLFCTTFLLFSYLPKILQIFLVLIVCVCSEKIRFFYFIWSSFFLFFLKNRVKNMHFWYEKCKNVYKCTNKNILHVKKKFYFILSQPNLYII